MTIQSNCFSEAGSTVIICYVLVDSHFCNYHCCLSKFKTISAEQITNGVGIGLSSCKGCMQVYISFIHGEEGVCKQWGITELTNLRRYDLNWGVFRVVSKGELLLVLRQKWGRRAVLQAQCLKHFRFKITDTCTVTDEHSAFLRNSWHHEKKRNSVHSIRGAYFSFDN